MGKGPLTEGLTPRSLRREKSLKALADKSVTSELGQTLNLSWRDLRYQRFYRVVDDLVHELQDHVWLKTGKPKRRLKGDGLAKLHYSVECLVVQSLNKTESKSVSSVSSGPI